MPPRISGEVLYSSKALLGRPHQPVFISGIARGIFDGSQPVSIIS
jgi:hypothetical protein